jgi:hypothetical protein
MIAVGTDCDQQVPGDDGRYGLRRIMLGLDGFAVTNVWLVTGEDGCTWRPSRRWWVALTAACRRRRTFGGRVGCRICRWRVGRRCWVARAGVAPSQAFIIAGDVDCACDEVARPRFSLMERSPVETCRQVACGRVGGGPRRGVRLWLAHCHECGVK